LKSGKILIYDFGTTALKTVLFDEELNLIDIVSSEIKYEYPEENYIELEGEEYWNMVVRSTKKIVDKNHCSESIEIISLTSQAETLIPIDKNGNCVRKSILWLDSRASRESEYLTKNIDVKSFYHHTGLIAMDPILPIAKLLWIKNNEPDNYDKTFKFFLLKDYIIFKLTGETISDMPICSCSGLFDIRKKTWCDEILDSAGLDKNKLSKAAEGDEIIGEVKNDISQILGLRNKIKVLNGVMDQCGSAIGAGNIVQGVVTETTGTAMVVAATVDNIDNFNPKEPIPIMCHAVKDKYLALPYSPTAGIILQWFKDGFCELQVKEAGEENIPVYQKLDLLASKDSTKRNSLIFLPNFCGVVSPVSNPRAKGVLFGLGMDTGRNEIIRAILESVAFLFRDYIEFLVVNGFEIKEIISLGGGSRSNLWMNIKSSTLNRSISTLGIEETTSLGCAALAAVKLGYLKDLWEINKVLKIRKRFDPDPKEALFLNGKYELFGKVNKACMDIF
jgi:xylulokinase